MNLAFRQQISAKLSAWKGAEITLEIFDKLQEG